jgi:hypothetical protein
MSPDPSRHVPLRQPTAFHVPVCLPPLPAANRKTCLLARPAMSLCARQHHSRDQAVSLPARSYSCNPSWGGGGSLYEHQPPPPPQEAVETVLPFGRFFGCITQKGPKPTATVWPILYRRGRNGAELLKN